MIAIIFYLAVLGGVDRIAGRHALHALLDRIVAAGAGLAGLAVDSRPFAFGLFDPQERRILEIVVLQRPGLRRPEPVAGDQIVERAALRRLDVVFLPLPRLERFVVCRGAGHGTDGERRKGDRSDRYTQHLGFLPLFVVGRSSGRAVRRP
ncbi:MAG: hypothetical protein OXF57_01390 [Rhodospirillaceae bacterium]|nr:hypothetical protein [Rhodospirillaceae bacterium]